MSRRENAQKYTHMQHQSTTIKKISPDLNGEMSNTLIGNFNTTQ